MTMKREKCNPHSRRIRHGRNPRETTVVNFGGSAIRGDNIPGNLPRTESQTTSVLRMY